MQRCPRFPSARVSAARWSWFSGSQGAWVFVGPGLYIAWNIDRHFNIATMQAYSRHSSSVRPEVGRLTWAFVTFGRPWTRSVPLSSMVPDFKTLGFDGKPQAQNLVEGNAPRIRHMVHCAGCGRLGSRPAWRVRAGLAARGCAPISRRRSASRVLAAASASYASAGELLSNRAVFLPFRLKVADVPWIWVGWGIMPSRVFL